MTGSPPSRAPADRDPDPLDEVVDAVRRGDRDAIAAVYLAVAPGLRGYLRRRIGHGEVADDLVEQAFLALLEQHDRFRGDGRALRAWLYRTARNDLADWRKRADRRSDHELRPVHLAGTGTAGREGDPAAHLDDAAYDPPLEAALQRCTEEQREVLELRLVAGLPIADVAALTGRTAGAVKLLQHRALRRLARLLADGPDPGDP